MRRIKREDDFFYNFLRLLLGTESIANEEFLERIKKEREFVLNNKGSKESIDFIDSYVKYIDSFLEKEGNCNGK